VAGTAIGASALTTRATLIQQRKLAEDARLGKRRADIYQRLAVWLANARLPSDDAVSPYELNYAEAFCVDMPPKLVAAASIWGDDSVKSAVTRLHQAALNEAEDVHHLDMILSATSPGEIFEHSSVASYRKWTGPRDAASDINKRRIEWVAARADLRTSLQSAYDAAPNSRMKKKPRARPWRTTRPQSHNT